MRENSVRLEVLRTLIAVFDTGSVVRAAQRQGYSTSAVSRQIGAIQRELGAILFAPAGRGIRPTAEMIGVVEEMRDVIERADRLQLRLRAIRSRGDYGHHDSTGGPARS